MKKLLLFLFVFSFSISNGQQRWIWGTQGTTSNAPGEGYGIAVDLASNVYGTGYFAGNITVGSFMLSGPVANSTAYIIKYRADGVPLWVGQSINTTQYGSTAGFCVATDLTKNVYMAGSAIDTSRFGVDTVFGNSYLALHSNILNPNSFLIKYDSNGNILWLRQSIGASPKCVGQTNSVCTDNKKNVCITGYLKDTIKFGSYTLIDNSESPFLVKYDSSGNVKWAQQAFTISTLDISKGNGVVADSKDNIYITGGFRDSTHFGRDSLYSAYNGFGDMFLVKYNASGSVLWARQSKSNSFKSNAGGMGIAVDKFSNVYMTGEFQDTVNFGNVQLIAQGTSTYDIFIAKYDSNGTLIWAKTAVTFDNDVWEGYTIAADTNGHVFVSFGASGNHDFAIKYGTTTFITHIASTDGGSLIMKLDTAGNLICGNIVAGGGDDQNQLVCVPNGDYVYFGGDMWATTIFGTDTLTLQGNETPFMAKWQPCGVVITDEGQSHEEKKSITLFPNPNNGSFTIQTEGAQNFVPATIEIYNVLGEKVYTQFTTHNSPLTIDLNQPNGLYLYRVISAEGDLIGEGKLVISK